MLHYFWTLFALITAIYRHSPSNSLEFDPIDCIQQSPIKSLQDAVDCLDKYTVGPDYYNERTYALAQPNLPELAAFIDLVTSLLYVDSNCTSLRVPSTLSRHFQISLLSESEAKDEDQSYCVLHEYTSKNGSYAKGWGLMAVPASLSYRRNSTFHLFAPHPVFDLHTPQQAAALFARAGARSLYITGRSRLALRNSTSCIHNAKYYTTDPCHDNNEPFHAASMAIYRWQQANGGCPSSTCAFIQMHGKGHSTCPTDQVFLSSGLGRSPSSIDWYTDDVDRPIKRLRANLQRAFFESSWNISMPSDSSCTLTATSNVFGRFVNGIDASQVCKRGSNASLATGEFVHVEQAIVAREAGSYDGWVQALRETFGKQMADIS